MDKQRYRQLVAMIRKGRLDALLPLADLHEEDGLTVMARRLRRLHDYYETCVAYSVSDGYAGRSRRGALVNVELAIANTRNNAMKVIGSRVRMWTRCDATDIAVDVYRERRERKAVPT